MAAEITILGWKAIGFRCPDHEINLMNKSDTLYPVSLIQMPNGTGKTTTLNLIQAALSGLATNWSSSRIREFEKRDNIDRKANFEMSLLLNEKKFTVQMHFDFEEGIVRYKTTYGTGQKDGFLPPREFKKFLSENFVKFYVFDGELAEKLLNHNDTNAENVIEHLFQIDHIQIIKRAIEKYWEDATSNQSATEEKGLTQAKKNLKDKKEKLKRYEKDIKILEEEEEKNTEELKKLKEKYESELQRSREYSDELRNLQGELRNTEAEEKSLSTVILEKMTDATNLSTKVAKELHDFKNSLDRVKLPETAAREFFQELAEETECVCGREITKDIKQEILHRAEQYLGSDDVSLLNSIKTSIEDSVGISESSGEEELNELLDKLQKLSEAKHEIQQDLDQKYLDAENSDPELEEIRERMTELNTLIAGTQEDMQKYIDPLFSEYNIEPLKKEIIDLEEKVAERTKTVSLNRMRTALHKILNNAYQNARNNISIEIVKDANEKIGMLMPHNEIRIEKIDKSIILKNQAGGSVGEQLSVAYAFLSTLFQRSDHSLPFIMDSPVGAIDGDIREEIANLIPRLAKQFIAFTISTERQNFLKPLENASGGNIQYLTLFRKGKADYDSKSKEVVESVDGVLIKDREYFNNFQIEKE